MCRRLPVPSLGSRRLWGRSHSSGCPPLTARRRRPCVPGAAVHQGAALRGGDRALRPQLVQPRGGEWAPPPDAATRARAHGRPTRPSCRQRGALRLAAASARGGHARRLSRGSGSGCWHGRPAHPSGGSDARAASRPAKNKAFSPLSQPTSGEASGPYLYRPLQTPTDPSPLAQTHGPPHSPDLAQDVIPPGRIAGYPARPVVDCN